MRADFQNLNVVGTKGKRRTPSSPAYIGLDSAKPRVIAQNESPVSGMDFIEATYLV